MRRLLIVAGLVAAATPMQAAETIIAVSANFAAPAEEIAAAFTAETGNRVMLSFGATGALYAQITQGAPFAVFLAADDQRPTTAVAEGLALSGTVFTYAIGKLALYSPDLDLTDGAAVLAAGDFQRLAIAEPSAAPYGAAAVEVLAALGLTDAVAPRLVTGENISQTLQFIDSGNAELGFVALSQVIDTTMSQVWVVPSDLYTPIRQDAVLLKAGADDAVARTFLEFLDGPEARTVIQSYGYEVGP
jgi:molybdate transport system substrate-binding protein